jgi:hypothetical protein
MSDEGEEDHVDTSKRLDEEFAGSTEVRGTTRERIKTGITGAAAALGFKTSGLVGTAWSQAVSATLQASGYVSMAGGGVGNGSISQLLAPVSVANSPSQTSSSAAVILPDRMVSGSAARQRASRENKKDKEKAAAHKRALGVQRQHMLIPHAPRKTSPVKTQMNKKNWTVKTEIRMLLASVSVSVKKHLKDLGRQPTRLELDANSGGGNTLPDDLFYASLAATVNDPSFSGELGFEDEHLGPEKGARTKYPVHGTWTAPVLKTKWRAGQAQFERVKQLISRSGNENDSCYCKCGGEGFFCSSGYNPDKHSGPQPRCAQFGGVCVACSQPAR